MSFKFNSGYGAIICDKCRKIIREGLSQDEYHTIHTFCKKPKKCKDYCDKHKPKEAVCQSSG